MRLKKVKILIIIFSIIIISTFFYQKSLNYGKLIKLISTAEHFNNDNIYTSRSLKKLNSSINFGKEVINFKMFNTQNKIDEASEKISNAIDELKEDSWKIIYVNVGNGNGLVARAPSGKIVVVDCGDLPYRQENKSLHPNEVLNNGILEYNNNSNYAINNMRDALKEVGVNKGDKIDYWITTHDDGDHVGNTAIFDNKFNIIGGLFTEYKIIEYVYPKGELGCLEIEGKDNTEIIVRQIKSRLNWLKKHNVKITNYGNKEKIDLGEGDYITFYNDKLTSKYHYSDNYNYSYYLSSLKKIYSYDDKPCYIVNTPSLKYNSVGGISKGNKNTYFYKLDIKGLKSTVFEGEDYKLQSLRNAYSLMPMLNFNGHKHFIVGDANIKELITLVKKYGNELKCDIVQSAHHGTSQSAVEEFFKATNPYKFINSRSTERKEKVENKLSSDYITHYYEYEYSREHGWYNTCDAPDKKGLIFTEKNPYYIKEIR